MLELLEKHLLKPKVYSIFTRTLGYAYSLPELHFVISTVTRLAHAPVFFFGQSVGPPGGNNGSAQSYTKKQKNTEQQQSVGDHNNNRRPCWQKLKREDNGLIH